MKVNDVLAALDQIAPARFAFDWDRIGLQLGAPGQEMKQGVVCLDFTIEMARTLQPQTLVVAHHPLIWDPLKSVRTDSHHGAIMVELLSKQCAFVAAHTNWDAAPGGVNDTLAAILGLTDVESFGPAVELNHLKLVTFLPPRHGEAVFQAASKAGAGSIGEYTQCSFASPGTGTFFGSENSQPAVGNSGQLERIEEIRLEMIVPQHLQSTVEVAVRQAHPYEEPVIDWVVLSPAPGRELGRIGHLPAVMPLSEFRDLVDEKLGSRSQVTGMPDLAIRKVAVFGGAAGDEWPAAQRKGADVYVTGEFKHSSLVEASYAGIATVEAGHYATEQPGMQALTERLASRIPQLDWLCLESVPGKFGVSW